MGLLKPLQQRHKERDDEVQRDGQLLGSAAGGFSPILRPFGDARVSRNVDTQPSRQGRAVTVPAVIEACPWLGCSTKPLARTSSLHPDPFRCEQDHNRPQTSKNSIQRDRKVITEMEAS